jgi:hypothetical protein
MEAQQEEENTECGEEVLQGVPADDEALQVEYLVVEVLEYLGDTI